MGCCKKPGACERIVQVGIYDPATEETTYTGTPQCVADWLACKEDCDCESGECRAVVDE